MATPVDERRLKELLKAAIVEVLEERRDLLRDIVDEAIEDAALARAIEEAESTASIGRDEVFNLLEGGE